MSSEYDKAREHWKDTMMGLFRLGLDNEERALDQQFEQCILLFNHMKRQNHHDHED